MEVRQAVWNCGGQKSSERDDLNFNFIKRHLEALKPDFMNFVMEFQEHGKLVSTSNPSFIVLIPKVENPTKPKDFRPISLIGCLYKVLAKLLANSLKMVMDKIISECQTSFIGKWQIMDSVLALNEILDEAKRRRKKCLVFKADFERAYDSVNWNFLDLMMEKLGFSNTWRKWIRECLSSALVVVLLNGGPKKEFRPERGLHQGDPLSPFLFLIVVEGLSAMISKAVQLGN